MKAAFLALVLASLVCLTGCLSGDTCPKFAHIVAGDFGREGQTLWWTLQVEAPPGELTFNQPDVPAGFLEYRWAVELDTDIDGAVDLRASIDHFAMVGAEPITTDDIVSQTNQNLRELDNGVGVVVGPITGSIAGNIFRFETTTATAAGLASVTSRDQSTWLTVYRFGAAADDQCDQRFR